MPVTEVEYDEAVDEGIQINFLISPTRIINDNWKVTGLQCVRMRLGEIDAGGRRRPIPVPGSDFVAPADTVIAAVGQAPDLSLPPDSALERTRWETLKVNKNTLSTNVPGIFAGGDFVTGPGMIIHAVAAGKRGAIAIGKYLSGDTTWIEMYDIKKECYSTTSNRNRTGTGMEATGSPAWKYLTALSTEQRKRSFEEIELSFPGRRYRYTGSQTMLKVRPLEVNLMNCPHWGIERPGFAPFKKKTTKTLAPLSLIRREGQEVRGC